MSKQDELIVRHRKEVFSDALISPWPHNYVKMSFATSQIKCSAAVANIKDSGSSQIVTNRMSWFFFFSGGN